MDALFTLLDDVKRHHWAKSNLLGLLHILIGRRIESKEGAVISTGLTWRDLATLLKKVRWDPTAAKEFALEVDVLPPRDRQRYWYTVIARAGVDSRAALEAGEKLAGTLRSKGYTIGPAPGQT